jgi:LDH2 family malate/lactate/ureidoglycolate dehydrogenase
VLEEWVQKIIFAAGGSGEQVSIFARALVYADAIGRHGHGVWRLPTYARRLQKGLIHCPADLRVCSGSADACVVIDADSAFGQYAGHKAMQIALEKASTFGIAAAAVRHSNHFGAGAYFCQLAVDSGCIGIAMSNSFPRVAAPGSARPVLGTNPFAIGIPGSPPFIYDTSTSSIAGAEVLLAAQRGEMLPDGVAVDEHGVSVRDPNSIDHAALYPMAGGKGFGLSLMVEVLSAALSAGASSTEVRSMFKDFTANGDNAHFFVVIDPAHFGEPRAIANRTDRIFQDIIATALPGRAVRIPGYSRSENMKRALAKGVELTTKSKNALIECGDAFSLELPGWLHV